MSFTDIIRSVAPMLATTLAAPLGPLAPLAGMAVSSIISAVSPDAATQVTAAQTEGGLQGAIAKVQDLFQQGVINAADLKKAELAHAERMAELGFKSTMDLETIAAGDRDSARKREETVKDSTPAVLAYMIIGGFFAVSVAQLVGIMGYPDLVAKIPSQGWLLIGNVSGYLANEAKQAAAYYFGSSIGSKEKDATIAEIAKAP